MEDPLKAVEIAIDFAQYHADWYEGRADNRWIFYRIFGVVSILSSILVTFFAASLFTGRTHFGFINKSILVAVLALLSTISISLSGFYGWKKSWESYRTAQLKIETLITISKIQQLKFTHNKNYTGLFDLAEIISKSTGEIVHDETTEFYKGLGDLKVLIEEIEKEPKK